MRLAGSCLNLMWCSLNFAYRSWMISYHISILYDISIGIGCPNHGAQFDKSRLEGYALIKQQQY